MRVINERWNELENELGLGLPLNTLSEVDIANKWRLRALNVEKLLNNPSLTIPKSIADELDGVFVGIDATDIGYVLDQTGPYGSRAFNDYYFKNKNIIALYLAGKALGVDLVKVVADE